MRLYSGSTFCSYIPWPLSCSVPNIALQDGIVSKLMPTHDRAAVEAQGKGSISATRGSGSTKQMQCLSHERQWKHEAKAVS